MNFIDRILGRKKNDLGSAAFKHNSLNNVERLNSDHTHWLKSRAIDEIFINKAYNQIIGLTRMAEAYDVADFGCGTGVLINKINNDFPRIYVKGYDFSNEKIQRCREYYPDLTEVFFVGSVYDEIKKPFDVIVCTEVLEHLDDPDRALNNLIYGLRNGGRLLVTVPDGRIDSFSGHIHFWSPESWLLFIRKVVGTLGDYRVGLIESRNFALIERRNNG